MNCSRFVLVFLLSLPLASSAQGINFERELTWSAVRAKAKAENKYIFIDCFTTWCGPCKRMADNIFPQQEVGKFMNEKFISVQVQMDKTDKDNEFVKKWYTDAATMQKEFEIAAFPTLLFFTPDGEVIHRGSTAINAEQFLTMAAETFDSSKQYYTLQNKGKLAKDPDTLRKMALAARKIYDSYAAERYAKEYLATQTNLLTRDNLEFISYFTNKSSDKAFPLFIEHEKEIDKIVGPGTAATKVRNIILGEIVYPKFSIANPRVAPDWDKVKTMVSEKFPDRADEVVSRYKLIYYQSYNKWTEFEPEVINYLKNFGHHTRASELNYLATAIYAQNKDENSLSEIIKCIKKTVDSGIDAPQQMHIYANLLYKAGKTSEAISWQQKAIDKAADKKPYQDSLEKMKSGEKSWIK